MLIRQKKRHSLLKSARNLVKDVDRVFSCYADFNYRLKIKRKRKSIEDDFFTSIDDLKAHSEDLIWGESSNSAAPVRSKVYFIHFLVGAFV